MRCSSPGFRLGCGTRSTSFGCGSPGFRLCCSRRSTSLGLRFGLRCRSRGLRRGSLRRCQGHSLHPCRRGCFLLFQRLGGGNIRRVPAIGLRIGSLVGPGGCRVLGLERCRSRVRLFRGYLLSLIGRVLNASRSAIVCDMIGIGHNALLHNRIVHIGHIHDTHIHPRHRGVVGKRTAPPLAARESNAAEAESIVHAAVVSNGLAPIAVVEPVLPAIPSPVGRRPQRAAVWSRHPRARHPVVISVIV